MYHMEIIQYHCLASTPMASLEAHIANNVLRLQKSKARQIAKQQRHAYYTAPGPSLQLLHGGIPATQTRGAQCPMKDNRKETLAIKGALNENSHMRSNLEGKDKGRQEDEEPRSSEDPRRQEAEAQRREEMRKQEEEDAQRQYIEDLIQQEAEAQRRSEERRQAEEAQRRYVEEMRMQEEEEAQRWSEEMRRQEEEAQRRCVDEMRRQEEEAQRRYVEEMRRQEDVRRFEEMKMEEEARRQYEELKRREEAQNSSRLKARNIHGFHPYMNARKNNELEQINEVCVPYSLGLQFSRNY